MRSFSFDSETHIYRWDDTGMRIPSVNQILQDVGLVDFSMVPPDKLATAQARGTNVHLATEYHDLGTLDTIDPEHEPYLQGWKQFLAAYGFSFRPDQIETKLASEVHNFAGTLDRWRDDLAKIVWLIDEKTGSTVYPSTGIQLAGYEILIKENHPEFRDYKFIRLAVQLKKTGVLKYKIHEFKDPGDLGTFIGCKNKDQAIINAWKQKHLKGAIL